MYIFDRLVDLICVSVVCQCWWYEDWQSSSPLFHSSSTSLLAYISSINPVLGGLLWSLCVLWAMVIICPLCSRCFMCLVDSFRPTFVPHSLSYSQFISHALAAYAFSLWCTLTVFLSPSLFFMTVQHFPHPFIPHYIQLRCSAFWYLSLTHILSAVRMQTRKMDPHNVSGTHILCWVIEIKIFPWISLHF